MQIYSLFCCHWEGEKYSIQDLEFFQSKVNLSHVLPLLATVSQCQKIFCSKFAMQIFHWDQVSWQVANYNRSILSWVFVTNPPELSLTSWSTRIVYRMVRTEEYLRAVFSCIQTILTPCIMWTPGQLCINCWLIITQILIDIPLKDVWKIVWTTQGFQRHLLLFT